MSEIAFGGVEIGIPYGIGIEHESQLLAECDAIALLRQALDGGINLFDTARMYGRSEALIGKAFKGRRDQVVISTKCFSLHDDQHRLLSGRDLRERIRSNLTQSLQALQTDYVDIFLLHQVDAEILHSTEVVQVLAELKRQGLVRAVGASIYGVEQTRTAVQSSTWDVVQLAFNLMDQRAAELLPIAQARGVGVMVRSVLLKGILSDRGEQLHPQLMPVEQHRQVYAELIKKGPFGTLSELAIAFVLAHDTVSTALLGIDRMEYLEQALKIGTSTLDRETLERARQLAYPDSEFLDLSKWKHEGWLP